MPSNNEVKCMVSCHSLRVGREEAVGSFPLLLHGNPIAASCSKRLIEKEAPLRIWHVESPVFHFGSSFGWSQKRKEERPGKKALGSGSHSEATFGPCLTRDFSGRLLYCCTIRGVVAEIKLPGKVMAKTKGDRICVAHHPRR